MVRGSLGNTEDAEDGGGCGGDDVEDDWCGLIHLVTRVQVFKQGSK